MDEEQQLSEMIVKERQYEAIGIKEPITCASCDRLVGCKVQEELNEFIITQNAKYDKTAAILFINTSTEVF